MEEEREVYELEPTKNIFLKIIITQIVCVAILIATVLVIKIFFSGSYKRVKNWYNENICSQTTISDILESDGGDVDEV